MRVTLLTLAAALFAATATPALAQTAPSSHAPLVLSFNPDAGVVVQSGDFRITAWGYAERLIDPEGKDGWRRVRQGAEFDLPRIAPHLRPALVYEVDLTNSDFFRNGPFRRNFENLFVSLQDADDSGKFRLLVGHNTHILSRDDNLPSGNLPTINRSLVLEEHGSVNAFGAQMGFQVQRALSPKATVQFSVGDNRGSLNAADVRSSIGRSVAGKLLLTPINDAEQGRKLTLGFASDYTGNITNRAFTLGTAIGQAPLGGVAATGGKLTFEADAAYTFPIAGHPTTIEGELIRSRFSGSKSDVFGGYIMGQVSLFDARSAGDFDLFLRYDFVSLGQDAIPERARQSAVRTGFNYNLPFTDRLASLHFEYAHNSVSGPAAIVTQTDPADEFRIGMRISLQRYTRH
ncbi:MAG: hypothetical protein ABS88_01975 [Sphingopyxis sp. SCN 67-31]|nr:MAG: hypothetical protein ABS88_01975 [Sphingopyxis sp. SCN 67-31]